MDWDAIGAIAEGLGAAGVIATRFYLANQMRQNTNALTAASYDSWSRSVNKQYAYAPDFRAHVDTQVLNAANATSDTAAA